MAQYAYIHIPFCKSKCRYCSFVSYPRCNAAEKNEYIDTLLRDIELNYKKERLKTLYLGGGTPSLLEISSIKKIFDCFSFDKDYEVTLEANPETVDYEYFCELKNLGINRISLGVQSFDDDILRNIGRIHSSQKAKKAVIDAQNAGFDNVSCDFIYGLPNQSLAGFVSDLKTAVELGVRHVSLYGLKIEEGCWFFENAPKNLPDDDMQADMYVAAVNLLTKSGFEHYEISNFGKGGYFSHHNLNYWSGGDYYGFGAAAHGFLEGVRYSNFCDLADYNKRFFDKATRKIMTDIELLEEAVFLGLRRGSGIDVLEINNRFGIDFEQKFKAVIQKYTKTGHLIKTENGYRLSTDGFLLSNLILSDFL